MASVAGWVAASTQGSIPPLPRAVVQSFYRRMRAVAPAAVGAIERDRSADQAEPFADTACGRLVRSLDEAGLRALGMWTHHWCMRFYDDDTTVGRRLIGEIAARPGLGWTADEVRWMLRESVSAGPAAADRFTLPRAASAQLPASERPFDDLPAAEIEAPAGGAAMRRVPDPQATSSGASSTTADPASARPALIPRQRRAG
jgi:hypothetical protein